MKPINKYVKLLVSAICGFFFVFICLASGYIITLAITKHMIIQTGGILIILCAAIGFVLFLGLTNVIRIILFYARNKNIRIEQEKIIDAVSQISSGDFTVLIATEELSPMYASLAKAINDMAKNLGTIESMSAEFVSNVSHELQTPLTSISGFASILKSEYSSDEKIRHYSEIIESESKRLSAIANDLLKLSELDSDASNLKMQEYALDEQILNLAMTFEPQLTEKDIKLSLQIERIMIHANEPLLSEVIGNLIGNAIKFTPAGGEIEISLSSAAGKAVLTVKDTGIGILKEDLPHIFERFYKADKSRSNGPGGSGLGLSIVKKIIELHSGSVLVSSEQGIGSTFQVFFPVYT